MSGFFYHYDDEAAARAAVPGCFIKLADGSFVPVAHCRIRSRRGIWITPPVESNHNAAGEPGSVTNGERSKPFVILVPDEIDGQADALIQPAGEQGFA